MTEQAIIRTANALAMRYARGVENTRHIEASDLAGAAILGHLLGRRMRHAIVDEIRSIGGRKYEHAGQLFAGVDVLIPEPKYLVRLALKRFGVLMINWLSGKRRRVILLRYWWDLTQAETAQELGVSPGRVGQLEREACKTIAAELRRRGIKSLRDVV